MSRTLFQIGRSALLVAATLGAVLALLAPAAAQRTPPPAVAFDRKAFEDELHAKLAGTVMGYSFVLVRNNQIMAEGARGKARNARDGELAMTTRTPLNIGSLFKFVSGVSLLHAFEQAPAGSAAGQNSFESILDTSFVLLLPAVWTSEIKAPAIRGLSFRQLLQHKTGFRSDDMQAVFRGEFDERLMGRRDYQNLNFTIVGYTLGAFVKPSVLSTINNFDRNVPSSERSLTASKALGQEMDLFIRHQVMKAVPGGAAASCDAANEFKATAAYAYRSRTDGEPGIVTSRKAEGKPCIGAGGYWMSARDLASFASTALHTDKLLSPATRRLMLGNGVPDSRLVWSSASPSNWTATHFGEPDVFGSGGRQPYGGGQVSGGALLRLPQNYVLVVLANSPEWQSDDLSNFGFAAFRAGMAEGLR